MIVQVQLSNESPAVLSLGKLFEANGAGDAERSQKILTSRIEPKIHLHGQPSGILSKLAKSRHGIMRDLLRTDPKHMELQKELYDQ